MDTIIQFLDDYLTRSGRTHISPVEANALLERAGLLRNHADRPGKPLRDLLRKGAIPHAYQTGGKGSEWIIPHSGKSSDKTPGRINTDSSVHKKSTDRKISSTPQPKDTSLTEKILMNEKNFKSAGSIDHLVPHQPGLYCIRIRSVQVLPAPLSEILKQRNHNVMYIGIASQNLNKRFLNQELRANGHGTFFRSIGAVLGFRPPKGSRINHSNKRNYQFSEADEQKIIQWINENLMVNWVVYNEAFEMLEAKLIHQYRPLINIAKNPSALPLLTDLRNECVRIASGE